MNPRKVSFNTLEAIAWSNSELPGGDTHPDYVNTDNMTCYCDCGGYFELQGDGVERCNLCMVELESTIQAQYIQELENSYYPGE